MCGGLGLMPSAISDMIDLGMVREGCVHMLGQTHAANKLPLGRCFHMAFHEGIHGVPSSLEVIMLLTCREPEQRWW